MDRPRNNRTGCKTEQQTRITITTEREKDIDCEKHVVCQKKKKRYIRSPAKRRSMEKKNKGVREQHQGSERVRHEQEGGRGQ